MKKEITMMFVIAFALAAVSVCLRQVFARPATDFLSYSYMTALIAVGAFLLGLFAVVAKRLFVKHA